MITSRKYSARLMAEALYEYGVRDAVISPGSRNTPLIIALDADPRLRKHVVIDERSAAFVALGIALHSGRPVACVCTSGSAVLNYAPAAAEAFYRGVPLILISADRPAEWIDQDDSQTIHQPGVLANIVKGSFNIADSGDEASDLTGRTINDALTLALDRKPGPIHINMEFTEPLGERSEAESQFGRIACYSPAHYDFDLPEIPYSRIMIVVGFHTPDKEYSDLLFRLWADCGIPVLCEAQSNVYGISASLVVKALGQGEILRYSREEYVPQLVISVGGSVVSKELKQYIRSNAIAEHWYVGHADHAIDCYRRLTRRFDMDEKDFLRALYRKFAPKPNISYGNMWTELFLGAADMAEEYIGAAPWCDLKAVKMLMDAGTMSETEGMTLHLSNGTAIRYAQLCNFYTWSDVECNRGVSGIDGSLSTAVGAALCGARVMIISGDMSAQYDMGALAIADIPSNFRLAVLDNHGGGIFRVIGSTANMDAEMRERYYSGNINLPLADLAKTFGFAYFEAESEEKFNELYPEFLDCDRKAILRIVTDPDVNARIFKAF